MARRKLTESEIKHKRTRIMHRGYGQEPIWSFEIDPADTDNKVGQALSWYNACSDDKHKKKWMLEYLRTQEYPQNKLDLLEKISDSNFRTYGALCRMLLRGALLDQSYIDKVYKRAEELLLVVPETQEKVSRRGRKPGVKIVRTYYNDNARKIMALIDEKLDTFVENNTPFSLRFADLCNKFDITKEMATNILRRYERQRDDIDAAFEERDEESIETMSTLSKYQIIHLKSFFDNLFSGIDAIVREEPKIVRKKRKIKPEIVTKKLKPLFEYKIPGTNLAVRSIDPVNILGASQLWIFNTKYRKLGVFNAKNSKGFGVRGTKILDYDVLTSKCKRVRKPNITLPEFMRLGKVALRHVMDKINQKEQNISPRINKDTILLRITK